MTKEIDAKDIVEVIKNTKKIILTESKSVSLNNLINQQPITLDKDIISALEVFYGYVEIEQEVSKSKRNREAYNILRSAYLPKLDKDIDWEIEKLLSLANCYATSRHHNHSDSEKKELIKMARNYYNSIKQHIQAQASEINRLNKDITELSNIIEHNNKFANKNVLELQSKLNAIEKYIRTELCYGIVYDKIKHIIGGTK